MNRSAALCQHFWIFECFACRYRRAVTFHLTRCPRCDEPEAAF